MFYVVLTTEKYKKKYILTNFVNILYHKGATRDKILNILISWSKDHKHKSHKTYKRFIG